MPTSTQGTITPGPPELAALFSEMKTSSEKEDIRILSEAGLLPQGSLKGLEGGDLYAGRLGETDACLKDEPTTP